MQNLLIISAGKHAREVYGWATQAIAAGLKWRIKGFLDSRKDLLNGFNYPEGIVSSVEDYQPQPDDIFLCAVGDSAVRRRYTELVMSRGGKFGTLVHPTVVVGLNVKLGVGTMVGPLALLGADATVGNHVSIGPYSACSHDNVIGDWCQLSGYCCLAGNVTAEENVFFGMNCMVVPGVKIGQGAFIGAASLVLRNVKPGAKMFGNPAVQIGTMETK